MSFIITARNTAGETYFYPASGRWTRRSDDAAIYNDKLEADRICANLAYKWKGLKVQVESKVDASGGTQLKLSSLSEDLRKEVRKYMKEGKTKMSMLPTKIKRMIESEHENVSSNKSEKFAKQAAEGYAWPGGYPLFAITDDGGALCPDCCSSEMELIANSSPGDGWHVSGADVNWEDPELFCDNCNNRIKSAYAEPEDGGEEGDGRSSDPEDDFADSDPWRHGPDGDMYGESKRPNMKAKQLNLSSLSEGLRQEVRKHMKEGRTKLGALPQDLKGRILKETGEWDESDEHMTAWKSKLESDIRDISDATGGRMKLKSIHGFDAYQGPYAWVDIDGRNYKVWTVNEEGSDDLWIENYKNDNTSMHDKLPGFQGRPDEIAYMLSTDHMMSSEFGLNELRNEISGAIKEGLGGTMPAETKSLWAVLGIKDMKELPQSPALPEIMQMLHDNGITGPFKYGRFGTDGLIYIMGNGGKIGIGLHNGKLEALSAGMLWDL